MTSVSDLRVPSRWEVEYLDVPVEYYFVTRSYG